jgi:hypothetical protein
MVLAMDGHIAHQLSGFAPWSHMRIMTWVNRGPRIGAGMAEQMEWFTNLYTDLMQFSHGVDEPDLVDAELTVEGIHLDWFILTSILPHLDVMAWPEDGRMKLVDQIMEDIEGISSITDEKQAEGFPPVDALMQMLLYLDPTLTSFCWCLNHSDFGEEVDGEYRLSEDWWEGVSDLVSFSQEINLLPGEGTMWENIETRSEEEEQGYFLLLSNISSSLEWMLDDWFKRWGHEISPTYESHREYFEANFDQDSEQMMRYFGFDVEDYFSRKDA